MWGREKGSYSYLIAVTGLMMRTGAVHGGASSPSLPTNQSTVININNIILVGFEEMFLFFGRRELLDKVVMEEWG